MLSAKMNENKELYLFHGNSDILEDRLDEIVRFGKEKAGAINSNFKSSICIGHYDYPGFQRCL
jgi:hypothetical protein